MGKRKQVGSEVRMIRWSRSPAKGDSQGGIVCDCIEINTALVR